MESKILINIGKNTMIKYTSLLVVAAIGLSPVVYAKKVEPCTTPQYNTLKTYQQKWPTMIAQSVPADMSQIFCAQPDASGAQAGAFLFKGPTGTLTKIGDLQGSAQVYFAPSASNPNVGDFKGTNYTVVSIYGQPKAYITTTYENYIDKSGALCLTSPDGGIEPNTETFNFAPNLMWYIAENSADRYTGGTTLFYDTIDPVTGSANFFAYFANIIYPGSPPSIRTPNTFLEAYYTKVPTGQCNVNQTLATLPNLSDDPRRVWELEGGIKMTGAQLIKVLRPQVKKSH
jgi:hypothetical protein